MTDNLPQIRAAVVQAAPILFDREATIEKACHLTAEAARQDAKLILFPEAFVPMGESGLSYTRKIRFTGYIEVEIIP